MLYRANLIGANLGGANLIGVYMRNANLRDADLRGADLDDANLRGANLSSANLRGANLTGADLSGAKINSAVLGRTIFADIDLSSVVDLTEMAHHAPSTIGIDTIYRSHGKIPEIFLRGAGVPENSITFMKSLTGAALDFYSCFISYSKKDQDFADNAGGDDSSGSHQFTRVASRLEAINYRNGGVEAQ